MLSFLVRGADHMLSEKSQWTQNGTMFVDLNWLLNASSPLSASAELLVYLFTQPCQSTESTEDCTCECQWQFILHIIAKITPLMRSMCRVLFKQESLQCTTHIAANETHLVGGEVRPDDNTTRRRFSNADGLRHVMRRRRRRRCQLSVHRQQALSAKCRKATVRFDIHGSSENYKY